MAKVREMLSEDVIGFYYDLSQPGPEGGQDRVTGALESLRRDREMISCFQRQRGEEARASFRWLGEENLLGNRIGDTGLDCS